MMFSSLESQVFTFWSVVKCELDRCTKLTLQSHKLSGDLRQPLEGPQTPVSTKPELNWPFIFHPVIWGIWVFFCPKWWIHEVKWTFINAIYLTSLLHVNGSIRIFDYMHHGHHMTPDREADISKALTECITVITELHSRSVEQSANKLKGSKVQKYTYQRL